MSESEALADGPLLRVHAIIERSRANGPGERAVIWTQGCRKACAGCFNPETWENSKGSLVKPEELAQMLLSLGVDGLTLTGGDPLEQPEAIIALLHALHTAEWGESNIFPLGIICYTGYRWEEIKESPILLEAVGMIDLLVDGRFEAGLRQAHPLTGSSNQRLHYNPRVGRGESRISPEWIESQIREGGTLVEFHPLDANMASGMINTSRPEGVKVTGFPPWNAQQRKRLRELGVYPSR